MLREGLFNNIMSKHRLPGPIAKARLNKDKDNWMIKWDWLLSTDTALHGIFSRYDTVLRAFVNHPEKTYAMEVATAYGMQTVANPDGSYTHTYTLKPEYSILGNVGE